MPWWGLAEGRQQACGPVAGDQRDGTVVLGTAEQSHPQASRVSDMPCGMDAEVYVAGATHLPLPSQCEAQPPSEEGRITLGGYPHCAVGECLVALAHRGGPASEALGRSVSFPGRMQVSLGWRDVKRTGLSQCANIPLPTPSPLGIPRGEGRRIPPRPGSCPCFLATDPTLASVGVLRQTVRVRPGLEQNDAPSRRKKEYNNTS